MPEAIKSIFAAWSESDPSARLELVKSNTTEPFYYVDPHCPEPFSGQEGFNTFLQMFTDNMPGATAEVVASDGHHGHHRAIIDFKKDGERFVRGQYLIDLTEDGKISRMIGFIGTGAPDE